MTNTDVILALLFYSVFLFIILNNLVGLWNGLRSKSIVFDEKSKTNLGCWIMIIAPFLFTILTKFIFDLIK